MAYGSEDFSRMALAELPELAADFKQWSDLLHVKMGAFAHILNSRTLSTCHISSTSTSKALADRKHGTASRPD